MRRVLTLILLSFLVLGWAPDAKVTCPPDMVPSGMGTCIDRYEWPNKRGVKPLVGISGIPEQEDLDAGRVMDVERLCRSVGKRVCTRDEWISACRGEGYTKYPFGDEVPRYNPEEQNGLCNYDKWYRSPDEYKIAIRDPKEMKRLDQSDPAGKRETCRSASGAYDMMGNAEEWVRCPGIGEQGWCLMGRYWSSPQACGFTITRHSPKWHFYETSGRCCLDADTRKGKR